MAFDQDQSSGPVVHLEKRTTKVNVTVIVGVILFIAAALVIAVLAMGMHDRGGTEPVPPEQSHKP